jgi:hypothetical protein
MFYAEKRLKNGKKIVNFVFSLAAIFCFKAAYLKIHEINF